MDVMKDAGFGRYHDQITYTPARFARSIVLADRREHSDSVDDWRVLRSMSVLVRKRIMKWAIWEYETAIFFPQWHAGYPVAIRLQLPRPHCLYMSHA
eukprot:7906210-Pyramimonas_sp.AAC.1